MSFVPGAMEKYTGGVANSPAFPDIVSPDGADIITVQSSIHSRNVRTIRTPHLGQSIFANLRHRSLPFHGARLCNGLPKSIRNITMCAKPIFKSAIENHLMYIPDEPLVPHITISRPSSPNSILSKNEAEEITEDLQSTTKYQVSKLLK